MVARSEDMLVAAYALARLGAPRSDRPADRPPPWLGVSEWNDAYDLFYPLLGDGRTAQSFRSSLKNARDTFDPHVASSRRGWLTETGEPPEPRGWVRRVLATWADRSDADLRAEVLAILAATAPGPRSGGDDWSEVRRRIERTTLDTVARSGSVQKRYLKGKELRCADLGRTLDDLRARQGYRCAQTGVGFDETDPELRASLDRIDSDGHYEDGSLGDGVHNLQLVTHWYNMAKGKRPDAEMHRMLRLHAAARPGDAAD